MALVEEYYELNETEMIPVAWKVIQILTYLCAGSLGLWCSYTMALIRIRLDDKCYLFTTTKHNHERDLMNYIDWEGEFWCDYCQYTMVCSFLVATIWATFFLMCGKGGKSLTGLPQPWRIVFCSLIFNIIYFSVSLSASIKIQRGTEFFCEHKGLKTNILKTYLNRCRPLDVIFFNTPKLIEMTSLQLEIVVKTSWSCTFAWLVLILIPFFRIIFVVDFRLYKICVFRIDETIHNKREEVLKITNYEEPKKLYQDSSHEKMVHYFAGKDKEDLEKGKKKSENKSNQFRPVRAPLEPNAAFYVTADIRMLDREKKKKKIKVLDEVFEKNRMHRGKKFRLSDEMELTLDEPGASHPTRLLYYSNLLFDPKRRKNADDEDDDEEPEGEHAGLISIARPEDSISSDSDDSVQDRAVIFKKQV